MKKPQKISYSIFCLGLSLLLMGVDFQGSWTRVLENLPNLGVESKDFYPQPKLYIFFSKENCFKRAYPKDKLFRQNQSTLLSLEDLNTILQQKKVQYNEETNIVTIQQIKRTYLAIDKAAYLEQDQLKATSVSPTIIEGKVYVPLRFVLEKLGYIVNYNSKESEILIVPESKIEAQIIAKDKIRMHEIVDQDETVNKIHILAFHNGCLLGLGENQNSLSKKLIRLNGAAELAKSEDSLLSKGDQIFSGEEGSDFYLQDHSQLYFLDLKRGLFTKEDMAKKLEGAQFFAYDQGKFFAYDGKEIFSYNPSSKKLKKVLEEEGLRNLFAENNNLYFNRKGGLFSYSLDTETFKSFEILRDVTSLEILDVRYPNIFFLNWDRSCFEIYNLENGEKVFARAFSDKSPPEITITGNNYVTVEKKNALELIDLGAKSSSLLDLTNLKAELNRGNVHWYWDGVSILGHWQYDIQLKEPVRDQVIEIDI